jgi:hypothetical protein
MFPEKKLIGDTFYEDRQQVGIGLDACYVSETWDSNVTELLKRGKKFSEKESTIPGMIVTQI